MPNTSLSSEFGPTEVVILEYDKWLAILGRRNDQRSRQFIAIRKDKNNSFAIIAIQDRVTSAFLNSRHNIN